jgi:hypothetical protein
MPDDQKIELTWGHTPWDDLTRDELLREVQRMYSANLSMVSALSIASHGDTSGFWREDRPGGLALSKGRQVRALVESKYNAESVYRAFFRYADDLLFQGAGFGWMVCDRCGDCYGAGPEGEKPTRCIRCGGIEGVESPLRPLTWDDLKPPPAAKPAPSEEV